MPNRARLAQSAAVEILSAVIAARQCAAARRHRAVLVLTGERDDTLARARELTVELSADDACWFGERERAPANVRLLAHDSALQLLGAELDLLVFDAWSGFDPDAFGALGGSLRAGGLLLLLAPPLHDWPSYPDPQHARIAVAPYAAGDVSGRFLARLARLLADEMTLLLVENGRLLRTPPQRKTPPRDASQPGSGYATVDQQRAVEALLQVADGHRRRPLVLISDRGRGKSAAFGIAAGRLAAAGRRILLTAPRAEAVKAVFAHAKRVFPGASESLCFMPADELVRQAPAADLLLVDEAAAIALPLLEKLLRRYARIAFASTVHGYEGTGRGFVLRFSQLLDATCHSWKRFALETPVRWAADDPLEALIFRLLALDAEPAEADAFAPGAPASGFSFRRLRRTQLALDEPRLRQLFGLLVQAHYRTRPLDLRHLLDGPNLSVYVLETDAAIAATALVADEGRFDADTARDIWTGVRRPHGHLLPETLAAHQGLQQAPRLRGGRVMRLAVHPALQRRGLGRRLVTSVCRQLQAEGYDYAGTSFGASPPLLDFWHSLGWTAVRLSIRKSAASGSHSALYLQPFTAAGRDLADAARARFQAQFPHQLSDCLRDLDSAIALRMLLGDAARAPHLDAADWQDLQAFAHARRQPEAVLGTLWRCALRACMSGEIARLEPQETLLVMMRIVQKHDWGTCARAAGFSGRKQALHSLRQALGKLIG